MTKRLWVDRLVRFDAKIWWNVAHDLECWVMNATFSSFKCMKGTVTRSSICGALLLCALQAMVFAEKTDGAKSPAPKTDAGPQTRLVNDTKYGAAVKLYNQAIKYLSKIHPMGAPQEAAKLLSVAASKGYAPAEARLAQMYEEGVGVPEDTEKAIQLYEKAAYAGHADAAFRLAGLYYGGLSNPGSSDPGLKWMTYAAEHGHVDAQRKLGRMYMLGNGVAKNDQLAVKWIGKAAAAGEMRAERYMGELCEKGQGIPKDFKQAVKWYTKSAEQGKIESQNRLADLYALGLGVPRDMKKSQYWLNRANEQASKQSLLDRQIVDEMNR